jgi:Zn-dependent M28 family amino/carboxypeptidase
MIPGTKPNEYLIVGAHYDHLGILDNEIYYGADDNASGTAAVIELGKVFAQAYSDGYRPQKTILFIAFTAEESGLIGSKHFVSTFNALANIKLMINIDMIGRSDTEHTDNPGYFYFIGHQLEDSIYKQGVRLSKKYRLTPDFTSTIDASDHKPFFTAGIPTLFFFDGINPDLHQPGDTRDKINYERMEKISRVIFETIWINACISKEPLQE